MPPKRKIKNQDITDRFINQEEYRRNLLYCIQYDSFYMYREEYGYYELFDYDRMSVEVYKFLVANFPDIQITASLVKDIVTQVNWSCYRRVKDTDHSHVAFRDKLLNLNTFRTVNHDRSITVTYNLPFKYEEIENTPTPNFENFLKTSLVFEERTDQPDYDLIKLVQEMFGYFLMDSLEPGVAFFLVGDGANGKSVMTTVIQEMIGREYVSAMSIQTLTTDKFATQHLIGKRINISNEEESKYLKSDKFKALITGEMVSAERKFGNSFEFIPRTKYLFASNKLPTFEGINYGIRRRIKIIPFHRIFKPDERDYKLKNKLLKELPGIVRWAIEGAKRLVENNFSFTESGQATLAMMNFEEEISSAVKFVRENYEVSDNNWIGNEELYEHYKEWCDKVGKRPMNLYSFNKDISSTIEGLQTKVKSINGNTQRAKNLIRINNNNEIDINEIF